MNPRRLAGIHVITAACDELVIVVESELGDLHLTHIVARPVTGYLEHVILEILGVTLIELVTLSLKIAGWHSAWIGTSVRVGCKFVCQFYPVISVLTSPDVPDARSALSICFGVVTIEEGVTGGTDGIVGLVYGPPTDLTIVSRRNPGLIFSRSFISTPFGVEVTIYRVRP